MAKAKTGRTQERRPATAWLIKSRAVASSKPRWQHGILQGQRPVPCWLYSSTHFAAAKAVRKELRRRAREQEAHAMNELLQTAAPNFDWEKLSPVELFFKELGIKKCQGIYLAVMDMWKPFRNATLKHAPDASILFDKFHVIAHLGAALDLVRKSQYARLTGKDRQFIKGQKYTLLSNHANLTLDGRRSLAKLLQTNKRLNIAYLLKESFGQIWNYQSETWARRFFENWKMALKWQRLKPYEKFARMIERHWDGIAAYCQPQNKVALGFVEGLNNKIRVIQRRAYGLRDEDYLRLKILTCMLPEI